MSNVAQIEQTDVCGVFDGRLCAAGRALVGWSQSDLAAAAAVARRTISDFENERKRPHDRLVRDIVFALQGRGITFVASREGRVGILAPEGPAPRS